jgi:ATP-dependent Clp protease ATP-binding subunit ClpA
MITDIVNYFSSNLETPQSHKESFANTATMIAISLLPALGVYLWKSIQNETLVEINQINERLLTTVSKRAVENESKYKESLEKISAIYKENLEKISAKIKKITDGLSATNEEGVEKLSVTEKDSSHSAMQLDIGINLVEKYKKKSSAISIHGRESEFEQLKIAVGKAETPNAILVGPPGCGKTTLVEAWAQEIAQNNDPNYLFKETQIISISASDIVGGASYVGILEKRVNQLIEYGRRNPNVIYFIDELHSIMHDGSSSSNGIPNMLKKALSDGDIRMIGCTTNEEFELIKDDSAFTRRFSFLSFEAPTEVMIQNIIETKVEKKYAIHHQVVYSDEVIQNALKMAENLPGNDPARTLSLLDTAGSLARLRGLKVVTMEILSECVNNANAKVK